MGKAKKKSAIPKYLASPKPEKTIIKQTIQQDVIAIPSTKESRKQKKLEKKQNFQQQIATVEKEKSSKRLKKRKKKPLPEGFISFAQDIAKSLPSAENNIENVQRQGKKAKSKEALVKKEAEQFKNVLEHPVFLASPLDAIREHLTNSIAAQQANKY